MGVYPFWGHFLDTWGTSNLISGGGGHPLGPFLEGAIFLQRQGCWGGLGLGYDRMGVCWDQVVANPMPKAPAAFSHTHDIYFKSINMLR